MSDIFKEKRNDWIGKSFSNVREEFKNTTGTIKAFRLIVVINLLNRCPFPLFKPCVFR